MGQVTKRTTMKFSVCAVEEPDNYIYGAVRMQGREGLVNWVHGITGMFLAEREQEHIVFNKENLFFYGSAYEYDNHSLEVGRKINLPLPENPGRFVDKEYRCLTTKRISGKGFGYLRIPIAEIPFTENQRRLITKLVDEAEQALPELLENLVKVTLDPEDPKKYTRILKGLKYFPQELIDIVARRNHYLRLREIKEETPEQLFKQSPRIWGTPMGGLPDWARDYWRRHPRK